MAKSEVQGSEREYDTLTPRETEVAALMAEGLSNHGIAGRLWISEAAVVKHIANVLWKLGFPYTGRKPEFNRRVQAVLAFRATCPKEAP